MGKKKAHLLFWREQSRP